MSYTDTTAWILDSSVDKFYITSSYKSHKSYCSGKSWTYCYITVVVVKRTGTNSISSLSYRFVDITSISSKGYNTKNI